MQIMRAEETIASDIAACPLAGEVGGLRKIFASSDRAIAYRVTSVRVDSRQLLADLEEEARRIFGPSRPPRQSSR